MNTLASSLMAGSAGVVLALGCLHLLLTFRGRKLHPRDDGLAERMQEVPMRLTRETTVWKAWIGFNASHSAGAILFGLVYGYLALGERELLFRSPFLLVVGALFLAGYVFLARAYWFSVPFRGVLLAAALYAGALVADRM